MPRRKSTEPHPALDNGMSDPDGLVLPPPFPLEELAGWVTFSPMQKKYLRFRAYCRNDMECVELVGWDWVKYRQSLRSPGWNFTKAASTVAMHDTSTQLAEDYILQKQAKSLLVGIMEDPKAAMSDRMKAAEKLISVTKQGRASSVARLKAMGRSTVVDAATLEPL